MFSLKPLSSKKAKNKINFGVFDVESSKWINHVVSAYYTKDSNGDDILEFFNDIEDLLDFCFDETPWNIIYAHAGGIFDFLFLLEKIIYRQGKYELLEIIPRGSSCLYIKVASKTTGRIITFRDSSALLPFKLETITKNFNVSNVKIDFDSSKITKDTAEVREYLESDVKGLWQSLMKMQDWGEVSKVGLKTTVAGQATAILRTYLMKEIPSLKPNQDKYIRDSYFGGRTEIFNLYYNNKKKPINYFDVNSLYPYIMAENSFPTNPIGFSDNFDFDKDYGFVECTVIVPNYLKIPPLPVKIELKEKEPPKLIFPTGEFKGRWASCELNYAMSLGCKVTKVYSALLFDKPWPVFRPFILSLYKIKESSPSASVDYMLSKLIMNSCYGRLGLNMEREAYELIESDLPGRIPVGEFIMDDGYVKIIWKYKTTITKAHSNVAVAAWVTALARVENHKRMKELNYNVWYTDTDSFFTTETVKTDNKLGGLKLEYSLSGAAFLLPKTYLIQAEEEIFKKRDELNKLVASKTKSVMKGFEQRTIGHLTMDSFVSALEGDLRKLKVPTPEKMARMKTAFRQGKTLVMLKQSTRQINSVYDKRKVIKVGNEYITEPWEIRNGKIINREEPNEQRANCQRVMAGHKPKRKLLHDKKQEHTRKKPASKNINLPSKSKRPDQERGLLSSKQD